MKRLLRSLREPISITCVLPALLAFLVIGAVTPVIATTYFINSSNADTLLSQRAELFVDEMETRFRDLLDPVATQMEAARDYIESENLDFEDTKRFDSYIRGLMGGLEQISGIGVIRPDGSMRRWQRDRPDVIEETPDRLPLAGQALAEANFGNSVVWSAPFVSPILRDTIINPRVPLRRDGAVAGVLTAGVTSQRLSAYIAELSERDVTGFVLYGRDSLIAYPDRARAVEAPETTELQPLSQSSLAILRDLWREQNPLTQTTRMERTQGHWANVGDVPYVYFYREIAGFGPRNFTVGVVLPSAESRWARWAATVSVAMGVLLLALAVFAAYLLGRKIAKPAVKIESALGQLETMNFERVNLPVMSRSPIAEWRNSAVRLMKTAKALASFNEYVPGSLARRLMDAPADAARAREADVTVMFVDMEGFSAFSRDRTAQKAARRLNAVFSIIGPIIERHDGVIDKYTGDGLMAFWGAPDRQPDHAQRAVSAALEMRQRVTEAFQEPEFDSTPRLRIGMHSGPAIVGNLGFTGRVNYTVVGTTANRAERVEQNLRGVRPEEPVVIGLSEECWSASKADTNEPSDLKIETLEDGTVLL